MSSKTIGPSQEIEFMGIVLDSVCMKACLPQEKLSRIHDLLNSFKSHHSVRSVLVVACSIWHPFLARKRLQFWCDTNFFKSILIVYSLMNFYISYVIFIYYLIVFFLVEHFIHEPLAQETG